MKLNNAHYLMMCYRNLIITCFINSHSPTPTSAICYTNVGTQVEDIQQGISLSITFFSIGGLLYFNPDYTDPLIFSYSLTILCLLIGIIGLGNELNNLGDQTVKLGFYDFGVGFALVSVWAIIYYFFPIWWINLITIILLFLVSMEQLSELLKV